MFWRKPTSGLKISGISVATESDNAMWQFGSYSGKQERRMHFSTCS